MYKSFLTLLALLSSSVLIAQSFIVPVESFIGSQPSLMVTTAGDTLEGELKMVTMVNGLLKSFTYETADGKKQKYKAEQVRYLQIKASKLAKLEAASSGYSSIKRMQNTDFDEIRNRDFIIFEQVLQPGKKDKYALLQLVNPSFDGRIRVYAHPNGSKSAETRVAGIAVSGGEDRTYIVVKDGQRAEIIRKRSYTDAFGSLYGDCPDFITNYASEGRKPQFKDMAAHVADYNAVCK